MKDFTKWAMAFLAMASLFLAGCGSSDNFSNVSISGKVTSGGNPVAGIRVNFTPEPTSKTNSPGPWASGVTNAQGEYSLTDRYKKNGAVAGEHSVMFTYDDTDEDSEEGLEDDMEEAKGEDGSKEAVAAVEQEMAEEKSKQRGRPKINDDYYQKFTVPEGGTTEADFDLPVR